MGKTRKSARRRQNKSSTREPSPQLERVQQQARNSPDLETQQNISNLRNSISGSQYEEERQNINTNVENINFRLEQDQMLKCH